MLFFKNDRYFISLKDPTDLSIGFFSEQSSSQYRLFTMPMPIANDAKTIRNLRTEIYGRKSIMKGNLLKENLRKKIYERKSMKGNLWKEIYDIKSLKRNQLKDISEMKSKKRNLWKEIYDWKSKKGNL